MAKRTTSDPGADVTDAICRTLVAAILAQDLRPGAKLAEDVIGTHFGVSRTIVRAALTRLHAEGLVTMLRNRGAFVAEPSPAEARALLDARMIIELAIVERAVGVVSARDLAELAALVDHEEHVHASSDAVAKHRLSGNFHVRLAEAAGNPVLADMMRNLVPRCALLTAIYGRPSADQCGAEDHARLIAMLRAGDAKAAVALMRTHLLGIEATLDLDAGTPEHRSLAAILAKTRHQPESAAPEKPRAGTHRAAPRSTSSRRPA